MTRVDSVISAAGVLTMMGVANLVHDLRRKDWDGPAVSFARRFNLPLPADAIGYVAHRLRTRELCRDVALIALAAPLGFAAASLGLNQPFITTFALASRTTGLGLTAWIPVCASLAVLSVVLAPTVQLRFRRRLAATAIDAEPGPVGG